MLRSAALFILICVLCGAFNSVIAQTSDVAKIKAQVAARGVGKDLSVTMKNGAKTKGSITQIQDSSFDITEKGSKRVTTIAYQDVQKVSKPGLSTGAKAAIFIGVGVAVTAVIFGIALKEGLDNLGNIGAK